MGIITDKEMASKPNGTDQWLDGVHRLNFEHPP